MQRISADEVSRRARLVRATRLHAVSCAAPVAAIFLPFSNVWIILLATIWCGVQTFAWLRVLEQTNERWGDLSFAWGAAVFRGEFESIKMPARGQALVDRVREDERLRVYEALRERGKSQATETLDIAYAAAERLRHYLGRTDLVDEVRRADAEPARVTEMRWVIARRDEVSARLQAWERAGEALVAAVDRKEADLDAVLRGAVAAGEGLHPGR